MGTAAVPAYPTGAAEYPASCVLSLSNTAAVAANDATCSQCRFKAKASAPAYLPTHV